MNGQHFAWDKVRKNRETGVFEPISTVTRRQKLGRLPPSGGRERGFRPQPEATRERAQTDAVSGAPLSRDAIRRNTAS